MTNTKITHGKIQKVQYIQKVKFGACKNSLELPEENKRIKCPYCNLKSNIATLQQTLTCRINLEDSNQNLFSPPCNLFLRNKTKKNLFKILTSLRMITYWISPLSHVFMEKELKSSPL